VSADRLRTFLQGDIGNTHASQVLNEFSAYLPIMRRHPDVVSASLGRFGSYLVHGIPLNNAPATFWMLTTLAQEIPSLRDDIVASLGPLIAEHKELLPNHPAAEHLNALLSALALPLSREDAIFTEFARAVVTLRQRILLVIGAGFSYDVMPITTELEPLLVGFLRDAGIEDPVGLLRNNDEQVWRIVQSAEGEFSERFTGWVAHAQPAVQHRTAAAMLHRGDLSHIVSFNWDDLIERAWEAEFETEMCVIVRDGIVSSDPCLWKLHGDVRHHTERWVFPYDDGRVFDSLVESLEQTHESPPAYALIVGYSESERNVQDHLVTWVTRNVPRVLRVRPNLPLGVEGVAATAADFFRTLGGYIELAQAQ
jgi:hypothetical protein